MLLPSGVFTFQVEIDPGTIQVSPSQLRVDDHESVELVLLEQTEQPVAPLPSFGENALSFYSSTMSIDPTFQLTSQAFFKREMPPSPSSVAGSVEKYKTEQTKRPIYNGRPFRSPWLARRNL